MSDEQSTNGSSDRGWLGRLIHAFSVAISLKATVVDLLRAPWYHPTLSEMVTYPLEEIAYELGLEY